MKGTSDLIKRIGAMSLMVMLLVDVVGAENLLLDVGQPGGGTQWPGAIGQSFKLGSSADLTKISIFLWPGKGILPSYFLKLHDSEGPYGSMIAFAQRVIPSESTAGYYDFVFTSPVAVQANHAYTFVLARVGAEGGGFCVNSNVYLDGIGYWPFDTEQPHYDMTFKVYGYLNTPPTVDATYTAVYADEGSPVTNTGTYSDADAGDNVILTASIGTITKTGTNYGDWDWTFATTDGPWDSQIVTVTADDGKGGVATTTFDLIVHNVEPTVEAGEPIFCEVGAEVDFVATFSDPGSPDTHTVMWNFADGTVEAGTIDEGAGKAYGTHTYGEEGVYFVEVCVQDNDWSVGCDGQLVVVDTTPPVITCPDDITVEATSPEGAIVSFALPAASDSVDPSPVVTADPPSGSLFPIGETIVTVTAIDFAGNSSTCTFTVTVTALDTTPPVISIIAPVPYGVYQVSSLELDFSATDDTGVTELNGVLTDAAGSSGPAAPGDKPGTGVYTLVVSAADAAGNTAEETVIFVVYDPTDGFVTGGGWIMSPEGAYGPDPLLAGKANFGFVSKYKKGATVPTGQTEFVFQTGNLNFHSSSYEWLVVTGSDYARFKGWGSINGEEGYRFMLWAGDAPDTFRIRIWTEDDAGAETDVYDNGMDQPIGGGSIVVHAN